MAAPSGKEMLARQMTEKQLQDAITDKATLLKWLWFHVADSRGSKPGFPDLCLVRGDRLIFIECKSRKGKFRFHQREWAATLSRCTAVEYYVARPYNLNTILDALD